MIRTLLASTAVAALMSAGAIAQDATPVQDTDVPATTEMAPADPAAPATEVQPVAPAPTAESPEPVEAQPGAAMPQTFEMSAGYTAVDSDNLASQLIDQPVYSSAGDDAEEIGNITDVVFNQQGQMNAVVIGVGGFLGIGEKSVAVPFDTLQFVIAADNTERWVVETTADALNAAPDFVWEEDEPAEVEGDAMAPADGGAMAPAAGGAMAPAAGGAMAPADSGAMAPADTTTTTTVPATDNAMAPAATTTAPAVAPMAMPREGYNPVEVDALTAENLDGATVIGPDGNDIAEVGDLLLTPEGQIDAMLVDFGGFLGIGQKTVAVSLDNLEFAANEGGDLVIYSDFTREQLEAQPEYDEATYATTPAQRATDL